MYLTYVILISVAICLFAMPIAKRLAIVDYPDGDRKGHPVPTPMVGGIAIMVPLVLWCMARIAESGGVVNKLLVATALCGGATAVVGFIDDQRSVSPVARLLLLALFAGAALFIDHGLIGDHIVGVSWGSVAVSRWLFAGLVALALIGFPSAVNMADGVNGVVVALFFVWSMCLAFAAPGTIAAIAHVIAAGAAVTLLFNLRGRLFLGDCGAFAIAFVLGLLAVAAHNEGKVPVETVVVWFLIPVADCLRLMVVRVIDGHSPLRPDVNHFHHRLVRLFGPDLSRLVYVGTVALTSLLATTEPRTAPVCAVVEAVIYAGLLYADHMGLRLHVAHQSGERKIAAKKVVAKPATVVLDAKKPLSDPQGRETNRTLQ